MRLRVPEQKQRGKSKFTSQGEVRRYIEVDVRDWEVHLRDSAWRRFASISLALFSAVLFLLYIAVFIKWMGQPNRLMFAAVLAGLAGLAGSIASWIANWSARIALRSNLLVLPKEVDLQGAKARESESEVLLKALEVFGDSQRAIQWMREKNPALGDETPIRAIQTETGRDEVLRILGRIEHGVIS